MESIESPLPQYGRSAQLQKLSFVALENILPPDQFVFRRESDPDVGADGSIELIISDRATNCRAQIQVKSTDAVPNVDGSYSVAISVANINYLLSGDCPMYVLYSALNQKLWYAWAHDERQRMDEESSDWMAKKKTVSIKFSKVLDTDALGVIADRIAAETRLHRRVFESIQRSFTSSVIIDIDPVSLSALSSDEALSMVRDTGFQLIRQGKSNEVIRLARLVDFQRISDPKLSLIVAYANYTKGRFTTCLGLLYEVQANDETISDSDLQFLIQLLDSCELRTGKITSKTYIDRLHQRVQNATGAFALGHQLELARQQLFENTLMSESKEAIAEMLSVTTKILDHPDINVADKLQATITYLQAEGASTVHAISHSISINSARMNMGYLPDPEGVRGSIQAIHNWHAKITALVTDSESLHFPLLQADALYVRAFIYSMLSRNMKIYSKSGVVPLPSIQVTPIISDLERAIDLYVQADNIEGQIRAKITLADVYDLSGDGNRARDTAEEILPKAQAMGFTHYADEANNAASGKSLGQRLESHARRAEDGDDDYLILDDGEDRIRASSLFMIETLRIPSSRLPVVMREMTSLRDISRERVDYCRHLSLLQDLRHTDHTSTLYAVDPDRSCKCELHGFESKVSSPDWISIITAFKRSYCDACVERSPKGRLAQS